MERYAVLMEHGVLLASGRDADVYALDEGRVLRRYRSGGDVAAEAAVMAHVAALGFPVPAVHEASGPDLVLERLDGPTLLHALVAGEVDEGVAGRCLAGLHSRLHALPPRLGGSPRASVLHLDLHPDNVLLTSRGPVVIDWRNATDGPAELDVALSALILAQVVVDDDHPLAGRAGAVLEAFLAGAGAGLLSSLDDAVALRRADPALSDDERQRLGAAAARVTAACRP
jgi:Ser/Thr protein kinase RdoA (MazF antagonist)